MQDYIRKTFSIIVPVYQNESNILETVTKLLDLTGKLPGYRLEYIFVDDGSTDKSHELLYEYHKKYPDVIQVVRLSRNFGQTQIGRAHV